MKNTKLTISKEQAYIAHKTASRRVEMEEGLRRPTHSVHKNMKAYSRKIKHK